MPPMNTDHTPLLDDDDDGTPVRVSGPAEGPTRRSEIARSLGCLVRRDVCDLGGIKATTLDAWAKRGEGPPYVMFGNERLYPLDAFRAFLAARLRERRRVHARDIL